MNAPVDAITLARDLLRCPSVTPAEGGALALIENVLKTAGFEVHRLTFSEEGTAPVENLYARIGTEAPHLVFAGHTDVVPPGDDTAWTKPPFAGEIVGDTLYGRGAVDMKGAIACAIAATLDHLAEKPPTGSISFLITGDEEGIAVNGTVKLLRWAAERGEEFDHCLLGEPPTPTRSATWSRLAGAARRTARWWSPASRATSPTQSAPTIRCAGWSR
jgi:succinyl-diaminopimelate desuccinylase